MPPAKKTASKRTSTRTTRAGSARSRSTRSRSRASSRQPAALTRLNKSLDAAQDALGALGKDVGRDVSAGARDAYKDLQKFVRDARRGSGKLGTTLERDLDRLQKRVVSAAKTGRKPPSRASSTSRRSTARRSAARRGSARKPAARSRTASRSRA